MAGIRFIPAKALASKAVFASYMSGQDVLRDGFSASGSVAPYISEEIRRDDWVWVGSDNLYFERLRELIDNCTVLSRCTEMAALFIAGTGVKFVTKEGEEIAEAQARFQEWVSMPFDKEGTMPGCTEEEWLARTSLDVAVYNGWSYDRTSLGDETRLVGRIRHRDVMRLRVGKADDNGVIKKYYWSADWIQAMIKGRSKAAELYKPKALEISDLSKSQKNATAYVKGYKQGRDYYAEPWYISAIPDAENHVEVARFNNNQLKTAFRPAVHAHFTTDKDEKELDKLYDKITENFIGSMGDGCFITFGREGEVVEITPLERGDHAGELDTMRKEAEKIILRAYGMSPIIYGMDDVGTGMDGASAALQQAMEQWQRTFVVPRQKLITRELTKLMIADGIEVWDTIIEPLQVIDPKSDEVQDRQAYLRAVTVDEHRENRLGMEPIGGEEGKRLLISAGSVAPEEGAKKDGASKKEEA